MTAPAHAGGRGPGLPTGRSHPWGPFGDTVLHVSPPADFSIDLRQPVDASIRGTLSRVGLEHAFGVVTAQDPLGVTLDADANGQLTANLRREVAALNVPYVPIDACSPDGAHCERSVAVAAAYDTVVTLGRRYDQLAIFWFDGGAFWIVPARRSGPAVRLPRIIPASAPAAAPRTVATSNS